MSSGEAGKKGKKVSIASEDVLDIQPVVYSFKGPPHSHVSGSVVTAARPPHWIYHDHVMGVIWMIFHKEKNYVGISQLQWCLKFLLDLKNSQGEYTGDVEICIQAIQDDLIEQYAKLGPALEKSTEEKSSRKEKEGSVTAEEWRSAMTEETRVESFEKETVPEDNESNEPNIAEITDSANNNDNNNEEEGDDHDSFISVTSREIAGTSTPVEKEPETSKQKNINSNKDSEEHCGSKCMAKNTKKKKEEILSFTYNEMVSRGPSPCAGPYLIADPYNDQSIKHNETELSRGKSAGMNSSDFVNFLNSSRQQQLERVNKEMDTLRILERLMENINIKGFSANNAEDLTKRLGNLQSNVITEAEEITKIND